MSKYYTPEIEEFHVGFEYETLSGFMDGTVKSIEKYIEEDLAGNWSAYEVKSINDLAYVDRSLHGKNSDKGLHGIRVKYLDPEDIEELGWKPHPTHYSGFLGESGEVWEMFVNEKFVELMLISDGCVIIKSGDGTLFSGKIKNKCALKTVLKQTS